MRKIWEIHVWIFSVDPALPHSHPSSGRSRSFTRICAVINCCSRDWKRLFSKPFFSATMAILLSIASTATTIFFRSSSMQRYIGSRLMALRIYSSYFGASFASRIGQAASQIHDSRDFSPLPLVAIVSADSTRWHGTLTRARRRARQTKKGAMNRAPTYCLLWFEFRSYAPLRFFSSSINCGTTLKRSPTMPKSEY